MKRFKEFLKEEMAAANVAGAEQIANDVPATAYSNNSEYTPTSSPKKKVSPAPSPKKPKPGEKNDEGGHENRGEEPWPTWDEWYGKHPMPNREDYDTDEEYQKAWENWKDEYINWLIGMYDPWENPDFGEQWDVGRWNIDFDEYRRRVGKYRYELDDEDLKNWKPSSDHPYPPGFDKEDYDFWWSIWKQTLGKSPEAGHFYDWLWRLFRHGKPGFENVEPPTEYEYPLGTTKEFKKWVKERSSQKEPE